jgi:hypothetical protein
VKLLVRRNLMGVTSALMIPQFEPATLRTMLAKHRKLKGWNLSVSRTESFTDLSKQTRSAHVAKQYV